MFIQLSNLMRVVWSLFLLIKHANKAGGENPAVKNSFGLVLCSQDKGHGVIAEINYRNRVNYK